MIKTEYKYTKCRFCGWDITSNDIESCMRCFYEGVKKDKIIYYLDR